ncbi:TonB-dependent receptor domain-containing protein [Kordia sp.]|uniref:TonB-dependent receptor domain-containing protein n=1 Tax=Kordia sp. TaxID=1965332 RepID=UPI003D2A54D6
MKLTNYKIIVLALLFISLGLNAQENKSAKIGIISGKVTDEQSEPLPYATIVIENENKEILLGGITEDNGKFKIKDIPLGKLTVKISYTGYKGFSKEVTLTATSRSVDLGTITLALDENVLKEVVITGEKSTFSIKRDKKVFTVGRDVLAQSSSAIDVLNNVPSVAVDPNGVVSLRGSNNVTVLINGRRSGLTLSNALDQIPAASIQKVEVITNPSARYDATGSAGILNIILKKNKGDGINGQVMMRAGTPQDFRVNPTFNFKVGKFNFFSTLGFRSTDYIGLYKSTQTSTSLGQNVTLEQVENEDRHDDGRLVYVGADYYIDDYSSLTLAFFRNGTKDTDDTRIDYNFFTDDDLDSSIIRNGKSEENRGYNQLEFNYTKRYEKKGKRFSVDLQYDFWESEKDWNLDTDMVFPTVSQGDQLRTNNDSSNKDFVFQSDFVTPLGEKSKLEVGVKAESRQVSNEFLAEILNGNVWEVFNGLDNDLEYNETIASAYVQYGSDIGKFNYLIGLRNENTTVKIEDVDQVFNSTKKYNNLFPTINLGYAISEKENLQLSYSRRINRPSLFDLNPFTEIKDFNFQTTGNPDLNPSYTNAFELNYSKRFNKVSVNSSIYYKRIKDFFQDVIVQNADASFTSAPVNLDTEQRYGFELSVMWRAAKWLNLFTDFNYYAFNQDGEFGGQNFDFSDQLLQIQFSAQFRLPKDYRLQAFTLYRGRTENAQTVTKPVSFLNLSLNKTFFNDRLTVGLNAENIFDSRIFKQLTTSPEYSLNRRLKRNQERFNITLVYKFTNKKFRERYENTGNRN